MASLEAGRRLADRYVLQERLGDGGHAEVWAATDDSGQRIALKFLHLRACSVEEAWQVLGHEAQMARRLAHPAVLAVGEPQRDGRLVFLPIEYASGGDAAPLRGAPWQQVLPILLQVAEVLEHAHSRGVVHRDIKPGNVLFDEQGRVRLTDFGTAARTGCSDALSAGSPFSASPAQLRDEPASTSDDVYGLGALAYELLSRYPPYFPSFDAARVQNENPPRLVPVHETPPQLVDCIMSMLARDPAARPDLRQVMQVFGELLQSAPAPASTGALRIEASVVGDGAVPVAPPRHPLARGLPWLFAAAVVAAAAFLVLPGPSEVAVPVIAAVAPTRPAAVADAVVERDGAAAPPATPAVTATAQRDEALQAGAAALAAGQAAQARAAFQRALLIEPDNAAAKQGLLDAAALDLRLADFAAANQAEVRGDLIAARAQYQTLLAADKNFAPARAALLRVEALQRTNELEAALMAGAEALRLGKLDAAQSAYTRAASLSAQEPRVLGGLARVAEVQRSRRNAQDLATGVALEQSERWNEAVAHYQSVASRDASLLFAQDGLARSTRRDALDRELQDYLNRPDRLTAAAVRDAAERALARGEATSPHAPRLSAQLMQLQGLLQSVVSQVPVAISSDNNTQVSVARVGDLGAFRLRTLALPPGHYTVVGRREGFRDVRFELQIAPGQREAALSVQCTEPI